MKRQVLAIPNWNGRISPVFDVARQVLMVEVSAGQVVGQREEALPGTDLAAQAARLAALGAQVLICGAISQPAQAWLAGAGVRVIPFKAGGVEAVLKAWLAGTLLQPAFSMPGCCGRRRGCTATGGGGRRWGRSCAPGTAGRAVNQRR